MPDGFFSTATKMLSPAQQKAISLPELSQPTTVQPAKQPVQILKSDKPVVGPALSLLQPDPQYKIEAVKPATFFQKAKAAVATEVGPIKEAYLPEAKKAVELGTYRTGEALGGVIEQTAVRSIGSISKEQLAFEKKTGKPFISHAVANWAEEKGKQISDYFAKQIAEKPELQLDPSKRLFFEQGYKSPEYYIHIVGEQIPIVIGGLVSAAAGALATRSTAGAVAGSAAFSYALESGSAYKEFIDKGYDKQKAAKASHIYGLVAAALESVSPARLASKFSSQALSPVKKSILRELVEEMPKAVKVEFTTESAQQFSQLLAEKSINKDIDLWSSANLMSVLESGIGGAIGGLGFGLAGAAINRLSTPADVSTAMKQPPEIVAAIDKSRAEIGMKPLAVEHAENLAKADPNIITPEKAVSTNREAVLIAQDSQTVQEFQQKLTESKLPVPVGFTPQAFFSFAKSEASQMLTAGEATRIVHDLAGDLGVKVEFVEKLTTPEGKRAFGKFVTETNQIVFGKDVRARGEFIVPPTTPYHEVGHLFFRNVLDTKQQDVILQEVSLRYGITDKLAAEERLVEDLKKYNDTKQTQNNRYGKFIADFIRFIQRLVRRVVGIGKVEKFYEDVLSRKRPSERAKFKRGEKKLDLQDTKNTLWQKPDDLTARFFKNKEIAGREFVAYNAMKNALKTAEIKAAEKQIIAGVLDGQFKDQKRISVEEFKRAVALELLPLDVIRSDAFSDYGSENIGVDSKNFQSETHIFNGPIEHGKTGHFAPDFEQAVDRKELEIVQKGNDFSVVNKKTDAAYTTQSNYGEANEWIESRKAGSTGKIMTGRKGLFGHTRVWTDGKTKYIAEIQSDLFQKVNVSDLGIDKKAQESLRPYRNIWFERLIREEIRQSALDGADVVRFPTAETVAKIEGYTEPAMDRYAFVQEGETEARIGGEIYDNVLDSERIIVQVHGDGSFAAARQDRRVNLDVLRSEIKNLPENADEAVNFLNGLGDEFIYQKVSPNEVVVYDESSREDYPAPDDRSIRGDFALAKEFNIENFSDAEKTVLQFYEKQVNKYLKKSRQDNLKEVQDGNGNTWLETKITDADFNAVEAFQTEDFMSQFMPEEPQNDKPQGQNWDEYLNAAEDGSTERGKREAEFEQVYRDEVNALSPEMRESVAKDVEDSVEINEKIADLLAQAEGFKPVNDRDRAAFSEAIQTLLDYEQELLARGGKLTKELADHIEELNKTSLLADISVEAGTAQADLTNQVAVSIVESVAPAFGRGKTALEFVASRDAPSLLKILSDKRRSGFALNERETTAFNFLNGFEKSVGEALGLEQEAASDAAGDVWSEASQIAGTKISKRISETGADIRDLSRELQKNIAARKREAERTSARNARIREKFMQAAIRAAEFAEERQADMLNRGTKKRIRQITKQIDTSIPANLTERGVIRLLLRREQIGSARGYYIGKKEGLAIGKEKAASLREQARIDRARRELIGGLEKVRAKVRQAAKNGSGIAVEYTKILLDMLDAYDFKTPTKKTIAGLRNLAEKVSEGGLDNSITAKYLKEIARLEKTPIRSMTDDDLRLLNETLLQLAEAGAIKLELDKFNAEADFDRKKNYLVENSVNPVAKFKTIGKGKGAVQIEQPSNKSILWPWLRAPSVTNMFDGDKADYSGPNMAIIKEHDLSENRAEKMYKDLVSDALVKIKAIKPELSAEEQQFVMLRGRMFEGADNAVARIKEIYFENKTPEKVGELTTDQADQIVQIMAETNAKFEARLIAVYEHLTNKPFPKAEHHFAKLKYQNAVIDFEKIGAGDLALPTHTAQGFTIERDPHVAEIPRVDVLQVFAESIAETVWYMEVEPVLQNTKELLNSREYQAKVGKDAINWWRKQISISATKGATNSTKWGNALKAARTNLTLATLAFRVSSALSQPFVIFEAGANYIQQYGSLKGSQMWIENLVRLPFYLNPFLLKRSVSKSVALTLRAGETGDVSIHDILSESRDLANGEGGVMATLAQIKNAAGRIGFAPLRYLDVVAAAASRDTIYRNLVANGVSEEKAGIEADFEMKMINAGTNTAFRPQIFSETELTKIFVLFQTFALSKFAILHDLVRTNLFNGGLSGKGRFAEAFVLLSLASGLQAITSAMINGLIKGNPPDEKKLTKIFLSNFFGWPVFHIPGVGQAISGAVQYGQAGTTPLASAISSLAEGANAFVNGQKEQTKTNGLIKATQSLTSILLGVPGTSQIFDIIKGMQKEQKKSGGTFQPSLKLKLDLGLNLKLGI